MASRAGVRQRLARACRVLLAGPALLLAIAGPTTAAMPPAPLVELGQVASHSLGFLDGTPVPGPQVPVELMLPEGARDAPFAAVVILNSASGVGFLEHRTAGELLDRGLAVAVVDSFTPRGVRNTAQDQARVAELDMIADAYAVLARLATDPRIRADRIAVIGSSKGAVAALYAGLVRVAGVLAADGPRFAAHVALYPWCGLQLADSRPVPGARISVHLGERDTIAPPAACAPVIQAMRDQAADPSAIRMVVHAGAAHAFDQPLLALLGAQDMNVQDLTRCTIREVEPGRFQRQDGVTVTAAQWPRVFDGCAARGGFMAFDTGATAALKADLDDLARWLRRP
ncbi:dienelactone hydrolase family protein [Zavarzinia sp. CC-PAN008]|uniref:dienelactone hydrolase family protein n=1 Tax=Zavarzinia sp. CC-PAN008 TaxID=3243332 RepID=UPI003F7454A8